MVYLTTVGEESVELAASEQIAVLQPESEEDREEQALLREWKFAALQGDVEAVGEPALSGWWSATACEEADQESFEGPIDWRAERCQRLGGASP